MSKCFMSSHYLTIFVNFYVRFTLFIVLLYFIISQRLSFYTSTTFLWHAVSHSYNVMVSFAFFVFVRHSAHCFLLLVSCMLYVVKKQCPEEAQLNRWAKRRLIIKNRSNLSAWFETWWQTLRHNNMSSKKNIIAHPWSRPSTKLSLISDVDPVTAQFLSN